jgi:hypothetical protein
MSNVAISWLKVLFLAGLISTISLPATGQVRNPVGSLRASASDDILPKSLEKANYNEFWQYQFLLNDGLRLSVTFSLVDFGSIKSPVSGVRISVHNLNGRDYQVSREYPIERLTLDRSRFRMHLHPERDIFFEGALPRSHRVKINVRKDGIQYDIDLQFSDIQVGQWWGDGQFQVAGQPVGMLMHIPFARVRGHVAVDDNRSMVTGTAYMDHTWQNSSSTRSVHSTYRMVYHEDARNWDVYYFMLPDRRGDMPTVGYRLQMENGLLRHHGVYRVESMEMGRVDGKPVPRTIDLRLSRDMPISLHRRENRVVHDTFGELGWVTRRAVRALLGGEVIDYRGIGEIWEGGRVWPAWYSFTVVE